MEISCKQFKGKFDEFGSLVTQEQNSVISAMSQNCRFGLILGFIQNSCQMRKTTTEMSLGP